MKQPDGSLTRSALFLFFVYLTISLLSLQFTWRSGAENRPVLWFLALMSIAFGVHLLALRNGLNKEHCRSHGRWIVLSGIIFRVLFIPSHPIQEVDIYRYMWDGLVVAEGCDPYQFSPQDVLHYDQNPQHPTLKTLVSVRDSSASIRLILSRVHFGHLTTIYPPISELVFASAAALLPNDTSVHTRLVVTKLMIVAFDVLAMLGMLQLLRLFQRPDSWLICYAWSPLVLKEFSNSGHLDAIAVGITVWAVVWWLRGLQQRSQKKTLLAAFLLGLGAGAKLYPVVFVPVIAVSVLRHLGARCVLASAVLFIGTAMVTLWPMLAVDHADESMFSAEAESEIRQPPLPADFESVVRPAPLDVEGEETTPRGDGLTTFVTSWRMNDFFFLIIQENLVENSVAWFSVVPQDVRSAARAPVHGLTDVSEYQAAFLVSRTLTAGIHILITCWLAVLAWRRPLEELPGLAFLSVASFLLLLPTLNPWYWIWTMPLLPFARRSWLVLSGLLVVYYLRFWLKYQYGSADILGTGYSGRLFFDFVVVWFEYVPLFVLLIAEGRQWIFLRDRSQTVQRP